MVNEVGLTLRSIARSGASGAETRIDNEFSEVRGFLEGDREVW